MYDSSGTIGPGINVGRAPKSTGAAVAAVTSASATAMDWSENCIGVLLISNVAGNQGEILTGRGISTVVPFYTRTKAQYENIFFFLLFKHGFFTSNAIGLYMPEYYPAPTSHFPRL